MSNGAGLACFVDAAGFCIVLELAAAVRYSNQSGRDSGNGVHRHRMQGTLERLVTVCTHAGCTGYVYIGVRLHM